LSHALLKYFFIVFLSLSFSLFAPCFITAGGLPCKLPYCSPRSQQTELTQGRVRSAVEWNEVAFYSEKRQLKTNLAVKVTIQLASLILPVQHNLCYWISNKPGKTSDFSKLQ
jgi:hypothetical protein